MSRTRTRIVTGFVSTAFVGFGAMLLAPGAAATPEGTPFTCTVQETGEEFAHVGTPDGGTLPDEIDVGTVVDFTFSVAGEYQAPDPQAEIEPEGLERVTVVNLSGDAAVEDELSYSATNVDAYLPGPDAPSGDQMSVEQPISVTLDQPGELHFAWGSVTLAVTQGDETLTTVCVPDDATPFHTMTVNGDDDNGNGDENGDDENGNGDDENGNGDDENGDEQDPPADDDEKKKPEGEDDGKDEADEGALPVTGAALTGLVAAAVAAVGGGGAAMYFSRRRSSKAEEA